MERVLPSRLLGFTSLWPKLEDRQSFPQCLAITSSSYTPVRKSELVVVFYFRVLNNSYTLNFLLGLNDNDDDQDDDGDSDSYAARGFAMMLIVLMTLLNLQGVKESALVVNSLTALKLLLVVLLGATGVYYVSKNQDTAR